MASDQPFVDFVLDQMMHAGNITSKKMFGEFGLYCNDTIFGLICDNKLFIKPTHAGRVFMVDVKEAPPYPGARPYFLIDEKMEDRDWLCALIRITVEELLKSKKSKRS